MLVSALPFLMMMATTEGDAPVVPVDIHVDAVNGDDANDGSTEALAIKTIEHLNGRALSAGDVVAFKRGQVHRTPFAGLAPSQSGTPGNPITFRDYGSGAKPKIFGSVDGTAMTWASQGSNIYKSEAIGYSSDFTKRINLIFTDGSPAAGWANTGGIAQTGIACDGVWGNAWTQDGGANRWYTPCTNLDGLTYNQLVLDGALQGGPEASISAVDAAGEWYWDNVDDRLYVGGATSPGTAYSSVVVARLSASDDWCYVHDGVSGWILLVHTGGSPSTQYSYLEIPNTKIAIRLDGNDYIDLQNLEVRHGAEGIWVGDTSNSDNCNGTNVDIYQVCRNGLQIEGSNNTFTADTQAYVEHVGSYFQQRPQHTSKQRLGHCYHLIRGNNNTVKNYTLRYAQEDGMQQANSAVQDNNWLEDSLVDGCREDAIDIKDGKGNLRRVTAYAQGDGAGRNTVLLHNNATGLYAEDSRLEVGPGGGDVVTRDINIPLEFVRCTLNGKNGTAYTVDCKEGGGNVTSKATVWIAAPNRSAMRLVGGIFISTHDTCYGTGTGNDALFELRGSGTNIVTNMAIHATQHRLFDINTGDLTLDNSCIYRANQVTDWINNKGTTVNEADIDGGYNVNGLVITATKTENPDFDNPGADDFTISAGAGAASGGKTGTGVAADRSGNAYDTGDPEIGAYSLGS